MKQKSHSTVWCMVVLLAGLSLSGCSSVSQTVSGAVSAVNPFQQQTEEAPPEAAPANEGIPVSPASSTSIRVETKPPAQGGQQGMEVNVGGNKQCTTFCALPMRKPPAVQ